MTDLISRSAVLDRLEMLRRNYGMKAGYRDAMTDAIGEVSNALTIDALPVVHAYWKHNTFMWENDWHCSHCDGWVNKPTKYCPSCGAMMDKRDK